MYAHILYFAASVLSNQAIKIKDNLLQLNKENKLPNPLDVEEVAAISNFTASESWSGKMARENGWNDHPNVNNKMEFVVDELVEETTQGHDVGKGKAAMENTEFIINEERQRVEKMLTAGVGEATMNLMMKTVMTKRQLWRKTLSLTRSSMIYLHSLKVLPHV